MSNNAWMSSADALKQQPAVEAAIVVGRQLTGLWPLHDHVQIDNDVKYAESFQVRTTRQFALVLTGDDVTVPDAEYVYEGADEIPGRPQHIVDALLEANDAYDTTIDFSEDGDAQHILDAADELGGVWNARTAESVRALIDQAEAAGQALDVDDLTGRYVLGATVFADLLALVTEGADDESAAVRAALPLVLYYKEFNERLGVPRVYVPAGELEGLRAIAVSGPTPGFAAAFVNRLGVLAMNEWKKHYEDVLWDPIKAKKEAREEDERKSKAALAAKFAHVKDDPNKETVEL